MVTLPVHNSLGTAPSVTQVRSETVAPGYEALAELLAETLERLPNFRLLPRKRVTPPKRRRRPSAEVTRGDPDKSRMRRSLMVLKGSLAHLAAGLVVGSEEGVVDLGTHHRGAPPPPVLIRSPHVPSSKFASEFRASARVAAWLKMIWFARSKPKGDHLQDSQHWEMSHEIQRRGKWGVPGRCLVLWRETALQCGLSRRCRGASLSRRARLGGSPSDQGHHALEPVEERNCGRDSSSPRSATSASSARRRCRSRSGGALRSMKY